ncbi:hypothetical protein BVY10_26230, partial [Pseudomonas amygdali pv. morsprunorum]
MTMPAALQPIPSYAPEHAAVGVDDRELSEIVECFNDAQRQASLPVELVHHLFDAPLADEVVRLNQKAMVYQKSHGWMTPEQAKQRIESWRAHCAAQGSTGGNFDKVVLSLFDKTAAWSSPWEEAGYQVYRFDIQDNPETGDVNEPPRVS